jgi:hypothetical protein
MVTVTLTDDQARELIMLLANVESDLSMRGKWDEEYALRGIRKAVGKALAAVAGEESVRTLESQ